MQVFTTCGSESKKEFLLNRFKGLKAENIGDSRSCSFEHLIMKATGGQGVHLVLNSLADDKLQVALPHQTHITHRRALQEYKAASAVNRILNLDSLL